LLKTHWRLISRLERVADNFLIVIAFFAAYYLRDDVLQFFSPAPQGTVHSVLAPIDQYFIVLGIAIPLFNTFLSAFGGYKSMRFRSLWSLLKIAFFSSALVFLCEGFVLYLFKLDLSRSFVGVYCLVCAVILFFERWCVLNLLRMFRVRGKNFRNILIVGTGKQARGVFAEISRQPELGIRVVGFADVTESDSAVYDLPARVVANEESFEATLKKHAVDEVLFTDIGLSFSTMQELAEIAAEEGVQVTLAADFFSLEIFQSGVSYFGDIPLIHFQASNGGRESGALMVKRFIDVVVSSILCVLLSPFLLLVALAIKLESPGPVFFKQKRVGKNGRTFTLLKFRSMIAEAESMLEGLKDKNEMTGPVFKIKNDPRVTAFGRFIRTYSIDELPQLINVVRGDMSLVGPRPPLPEEVSHYKRKQRRRLSMRPGLTCTWQVSGRNDIPDFEHWAKLDLEYVDNWSLIKDFILLFKTIPAVLRGTGAR